MGVGGVEVLRTTESWRSLLPNWEQAAYICLSLSLRRVPSTKAWAVERQGEPTSPFGLKSPSLLSLDIYVKQK